MSILCNIGSGSKIISSFFHVVCNVFCFFHILFPLLHISLHCNILLQHIIFFCAFQHFYALFFLYFRLFLHLIFWHSFLHPAIYPIPHLSLQILFSNVFISLSCSPEYSFLSIYILGDVLHCFRQFRVRNSNRPSDEIPSFLIPSSRLRF